MLSVNTTSQHTQLSSELEPDIYYILYIIYYIKILIF